MQYPVIENINELFKFDLFFNIRRRSFYTPHYKTKKKYLTNYVLATLHADGVFNCL